MFSDTLFLTINSIVPLFLQCHVSTLKLVLVEICKKFTYLQQKRRLLAKFVLIALFVDQGALYFGAGATHKQTNN